MPERGADDLAGAPGVNDASLAIGFQRGLDPGTFVRRQRRRFLVDRFDDVPTRRQLENFSGNVPTVPGQSFLAIRVVGSASSAEETNVAVGARSISGLRPSSIPLRARIARLARHDVLHVNHVLPWMTS